MCRSSAACDCDGMGPIERRIKEGLPNLQPEPCLVKPEADFQVPSCSAPESPSLLGELVQSQLALWTFSLSTILTWLWTSRKRCFLVNVCFLLPFALLVTVGLSFALATFVTLGRFLFANGEPPAVAEWVVKRLPESPVVANAGLLRRRRSLAQHSLRARRYRAMSSTYAVKGCMEESVPLKTSKGFFWQRKASMEKLPIAPPHRANNGLIRG